MSDNTQWPGRAPEPEPTPESTWGSDPHQTAPIAPPPTGAPVGLGPEPAPMAEQPVDWQERYEGERKRSRIFMGTTALAGALLVGSLFYASAQGGTGTTTAADGFTSGQQPPGIGGYDQDDSGTDARGDGGPGGRGFGGPGMTAPHDSESGFGIPPGTVETLFNTDGSLNEEAVAALEEQLDAAGTSATQLKQALAAQIAGDVSRGHITSEQAQELATALDLDLSGTGSGSGADSDSDSGTDGTTGTGTST